MCKFLKLQPRSGTPTSSHISLAKASPSAGSRFKEGARVPFSGCPEAEQKSV